MGQSAARRLFKLRGEEGNKTKVYVAAAEGEMKRGGPDARLVGGIIQLVGGLM